MPGFGCLTVTDRDKPPPTTTKVPVPFVVIGGGYQKASDEAAAEYLRAKRGIGLRQYVAAMRDAVTEDGVDLLGYTTWVPTAALRKSCYITS